MVDQLQSETIPAALRHRQRTGPPIDCELEMISGRRGRGFRAAIAILLAALVMVTGCSRSIAGNAVKAGSGGVPRNNDSERQYPNLLKECEVLTTDILAKTAATGGAAPSP